MNAARWILFVMSGAGALGALAYVVRLWLDWNDVREAGMLTEDLVAAWNSKFRQSFGLCVMLCCLTGFSLTPVENQALRFVFIFALALVADWKVFKMFTDRFHADLQIARKRKEEDDAAFQ